MTVTVKNGSDGLVHSAQVEAVVEHIVRRTPIDHVSGSGRINSNLMETPACYWLQIAPGVDSDALRVEVLRRKVTLKGRYSIPSVDGSTMVWHDLIGGEIFEVYTLPAEVDTRSAEAEYERGILMLTLPKRRHPLPTSVHA